MPRIYIFEWFNSSHKRNARHTRSLRKSSEQERICWKLIEEESTVLMMSERKQECKYPKNEQVAGVLCTDWTIFNVDMTLLKIEYWSLKPGRLIIICFTKKTSNASFLYYILKSVPFSLFLSHNYVFKPIYYTTWWSSRSVDLFAFKAAGNVGASG